jgi:lipid-A-disaccharide synthase
MPGIKFVVSVAPGIDQKWVYQWIRPWQDKIDIQADPGKIAKVLRQCTLVIAASGTVTLEAAIFGVPMVIVYRISKLSYLLGRMLVKVDHIGLANIIAGKRVVPELIQDEANAEKIANTVLHLLSDKSQLADLRSQLRDVRNKLGAPGASRKTAEIAFCLMGKTA